MFDNMPLIKFGKKEHLQQLKNGDVFFSQIKSFRDDGTYFRGDKYEGKIPINPSTFKMLNDEGEDILKKYKINNPIEITQSRGDQDYHLLMFCASSFNKSVLIKSTTKDNVYYFNNEFKKEMKQFGDYALLMNQFEFSRNVIDALNVLPQKYFRYANKVTYLNFNDHKKVNTYFKNFDKNDDVVAEYFMKREQYKNQNEWRIVLFGWDDVIEPNKGTGFLLKTQPLKASVLFDADYLLNAEFTLETSNDSV